MASRLRDWPGRLAAPSIAERPRDELAGALLILEGHGDQLDVGEPGGSQARPAGHRPLGGGRKTDGSQSYLPLVPGPDRADVAGKLPGR